MVRARVTTQAEQVRRYALLHALAATTVPLDGDNDASHRARWRTRIRRTRNLGHLRFTDQGVHLANHHLVRWRNGARTRWPELTTVLAVVRDVDTVPAAWEALLARGALPVSWAEDPTRAFDVRRAVYPVPYTALNAQAGLEWRSHVEVAGNDGFAIEFTFDDVWRRTITLSRGAVRRAIEVTGRLGVFPHELTRAWPEPGGWDALLAWAPWGAGNLLAAEELARTVSHSLGAWGVGPCTRVVWEFGPRLREDARKIPLARDASAPVAADGFMSNGTPYGACEEDADVAVAMRAVAALWERDFEFLGWFQGAAVLRCPYFRGDV